MNYQEMMGLLEGIAARNNFPITNGASDFQITYQEAEKTYTVSFTYSLSTNKEIKFSISFTLDFGTIQAFLNHKDFDFNNVENRIAFANYLQKNTNEFLRFKEWVGVFNGERDDCQQIASYILEKLGAITGTKYGL